MEENKVLSEENEVLIEEDIVLSKEEIKQIIEAILFASGHMVTYKKLASTIGESETRIKEIVNEYAEEYSNTQLARGVQMLVFDMGCQLITNEKFGDYIRLALGIKEGGNLSKSSIETLAIIAYNQPITKQYVEQVRGVDSTYAINVLKERELIEEVGRKDVPGRPHLYGTTPKFLVVFGLKSINDLPIDEFIKREEEDIQLKFSFEDENQAEDNGEDLSDSGDGVEVE